MYALYSQRARFAETHCRSVPMEICHDSNQSPAIRQNPGSLRAAASCFWHPSPQSARALLVAGPVLFRIWRLWRRLRHTAASVGRCDAAASGRLRRHRRQSETRGDFGARQDPRFRRSGAGAANGTTTTSNKFRRNPARRWTSFSSSSAISSASNSASNAQAADAMRPSSAKAPASSSRRTAMR